MTARRAFAPLALAAFASVAASVDCSTSSGHGPAVPSSVTWTHPQRTVSVTVTSSPFALTIKNAAGAVLLESTPPRTDAADASDPLLAYAPLSFSHDTDESKPAIMQGWEHYVGVSGPWKQATTVTSIQQQASALVVRLATTDVAHPSVTLRIDASGPGAHLVASVDAPGTDPSSGINRVSLGWKMHDDASGAPGDHFLGLGERFYLADHRGQAKTYVWVEDKGFGQGEGTPPGPANPQPNGPTMTYIPAPWTMSPRGFGLLLSTTYRTWFHLGDETPGAFRFEAWTSTLDTTVFADADPKNLLEDLTAMTGRPPAIADWVLAPRRRGDVGSGEWDRLRAAHVPTSVIDTAVHYFPNGGGADHAAMQAITADLHSKGFKAIAYFCPFVADSWLPTYTDLASKGWLVKRPDGTPYAVLDPPYNAAMIDFSNADAVAWYQAQMQQALDDGWDGWMYDFAEYIPQDAVFSSGMTGMEAHNLYPLLYQKAAHDLLEARRPGDYLIFVRSGYMGPTPFGFAGTGGLVPMVWAGDESTDFDLADGLPAALTAALNAGMSGIPLWGSDISGYHYVFNPPPDKELYLRWTELGAFSADMHDENEGAGNEPSSARWQIWNDAETLATYIKYAGLKTQMVPYVQLAVADARAHGWPVMRHPYLDHPTDPRTWTLTDEYLYGSSLLVAPVVQRGATSRSVYLPEAAYYDYWSGARVAGPGDVTAQAPLDVVPVFARVGAILPMLAPEVETVVSPSGAAPPADAGADAGAASDAALATAAGYAGVLDVDVFAGGQSQVQLADGTALSQSAPTTAFDIGAATSGGAAIPVAASAAELSTCAACAWDDPASHTWSVAVVTQSTTITAGPLTLGVASAPSVKRFVFRVRH